jgi:REP element-mobilizing transposase RayT
MDYSDADRRFRVQYPNAIYHLMSRGVQRSDIFLGDDDRTEFFVRCEKTVNRFGWRIYSAVQMTNHFHLLFKTPEANLCRGAQYLLGPFAQSFNRRHRRTGHVFEGRYRCCVVEDETYLWGVSRYDHLNPVPVIVEHPALWPWSSYAGYRDPSLRLPWICYDDLLDAWNATFGGTRESYCDFVEKGLQHRSQVFLPERCEGWIMGSEAFAQRIRKIVSPQSHEPNVLRTRSRPDLTLDDVLNAVCGEYGIASGTLARKSSRHPARPIVALLASENSTATLQEIATVLGLADRRSVPQVIQRAQTITSDEVQHRLSIIQRRLEIVDESRSRNNPD